MSHSVDYFIDGAVPAGGKDQISAVVDGTLGNG